MWLCTTRGFFSVVCGRKNPRRGGGIDKKKIVVRARRREHLTRLLDIWPVSHGAPPEINERTGTDYPCRIIMNRAAWHELYARLAWDISYDNFKDAAKERMGDELYTQFLTRTWSAGWWIMQPEERISGDWPATY